ncbi:hypothetical protein QNK06_06505 [Bacillus subtilis]|uniref:Uncharacterized protein n=3 Tax=Bacillus subtilis group TaxID=653685 RepID=G4NZZ5_BACS4|nr:MULTISPECIES: hypothetical protein [Bacillus subtilis group]AEP87974.1 conserved hypothetical protein [Bacillus spizizenii TU-B-10]AKI91633.1 hypothetical protein ABA10_06535 [Bacillus subtilis]KXJ34772.1 hypothetical protein AX282_08815 [Bacillus spizizenii]MBE1869509.1 hypothetical protein [Bacillus subtilis]MCI4168835.1 hypothetical protein [Bacillus spizizenii]
MAKRKLTIEQMKKNFTTWVRSLPLITTGMSVVFVLGQLLIGYLKGKPVFTVEFLIFSIGFVIFGIALGFTLKYFYSKIGDVWIDDSKD